MNLKKTIRLFLNKTFIISSLQKDRRAFQIIWKALFECNYELMLLNQLETFESLEKTLNFLKTWGASPKPIKIIAVINNVPG